MSDKSCSKWGLVFDGVVIFIHYKMINLDSITNENNKEQWKMVIYTWSFIQNHDNWWFWLRRNKYINLIKEQDNHDFIDKIYLYARGLSEPKYEYLIKNREDAEIKHVNNPKAFIKCSNTIDDDYMRIYENIMITIQSKKEKC